MDTTKNTSSPKDTVAAVDKASVSLGMDVASIDKAMDKLMDTIKKVMDLKTKGNIIQPNIIYKCFNGFRRVYKDFDNEEKYDIINKLYESNEKKILGGTDEWLKEDLPTFGMGKLKIYVGNFYNDALKLQSSAEEELEGLPDSAYQNRMDLIYPQIIRLNVYRILHGFHKEKSVKSELKKVINDLEDELGVENDAPAKTAMGGHPLEGMMNVMTNLMSKMAAGNGAAGEEGAAVPDMGQLGGLMSKIFTQPETQDKIGSMFNNIDKVKSPADLFSHVANTMNDPKLQELITGMVEGEDPGKRSTQINQIREELADPSELLEETNSMLKSAAVNSVADVPVSDS